MVHEGGLFWAGGGRAAGKYNIIMIAVFLVVLGDYCGWGVNIVVRLIIQTAWVMTAIG